MTQPENDLFELFSYNEFERNVFPFLDKYMKFADRNRTRILHSPSAFEMFMLAGLFLTYRACNHASVEMTTDLTKLTFIEKDIHVVRLSAYGSYGGKITSTEDYLRQIGARRLGYRLLSPAIFLINLVKKNLDEPK